MAFPPPTLPTTRTNSTVMATTHPADHNAANLAINDIVARVNRGEIGYTQRTTTATGFAGTFLDVGLSVTFTADPTRKYRTTVQGAMSSATANAVVGVRIADGAGAGKTEQFWPLSAAGNSHGFSFSVRETGLSGPVTRKAQAATAVGGTSDLNASAGAPAFLLVEDIGGP